MTSDRYLSDVNAPGMLVRVKRWWDAIIETGKFVGYYAKPSKSWLIVKEQYLEIANQIFDGAGIKITSTGKRHLGAVIGNEAFKEEYVCEKIEEWISEIESLAEIALIEPHAAYSAYVPVRYDHH